MRVREIFRLWLPLAVSFELMMLEGPAVQSAIGRLAGRSLNLAAWGLTMSLSLLVESPIIMLLATAIALVKDGDSYRALRRFMLILSAGCTILTGAVAFTPLFGWVARGIMGQPREIAAAAQPAMQIMLFWTAAIAWRRFYQGILVGHNRTSLVSRGTAVRLLTAVVSAVALVRWGGIPGVQVGAVAIMTAVATEACVTTLFAMPVIRSEVVTARFTGTHLTQRAIFRFHAPLAATTLLTLLAMPMTSAALARLGSPHDTLAASPVVFMLLLVMRGWGLALQEIAVSQAHRPEARMPLRKFAWMIGVATAGVTVVIVISPLLNLYLGRVIHMPEDLWGMTRVGVTVGCMLPLITALGSWARGILVASGRTKEVYYAMGINLGAHASLLGFGVVMRLPGMWVAAGAFTLASVIEFSWLARRVALAHIIEEEPPAEERAECVIQVECESAA